MIIYCWSSFFVIVKPINNATPAIVKIVAGYNAPSFNEVYVESNNAIKTPMPIPISNKAKFKSIIFENEVELLSLPIKMLASTPFSISAKRSLFLVDR